MHRLNPSHVAEQGDNLQPRPPPKDRVLRSILLGWSLRLMRLKQVTLLARRGKHNCMENGNEYSAVLLHHALSLGQAHSEGCPARTYQ